jgi:ribosome-binding protein aMBF1 (putative translation factor)
MVASVRVRWPRLVKRGDGTGANARLAEEGEPMKKTNFDHYLEEQLKDPAFADRFERAGEAWEVALRVAAFRQQAGLSRKDLAGEIT